MPLAREGEMEAVKVRRGTERDETERLQHFFVECVLAGEIMNRHLKSVTTIMTIGAMSGGC